MFGKYLRQMHVDQLIDEQINVLDQCTLGVLPKKLDALFLEVKRYQQRVVSSQDSQKRLEAGEALEGVVRLYWSTAAAAASLQGDERLFMNYRGHAIVKKLSDNLVLAYNPLRISREVGLGDLLVEHNKNLR